MPSDLLATRQRILSGEWTASRAVDDAIARAQSPAGRDAFVFPRFDEARAEAARFDRETALAVRRPLAGLPFSVKDLFDVEGQVTAAGSRVLADHPAATADCPAVARLRAAGGSLIGRTHMVEFAFSGMGTNPHVATPAAWDGRHDRPVGSPDTPRVPGGSSSGAAVSVATGAAFIGLGSDTGGSIRIPAALNGIVGFKNTASRVPTAGAVPLSTTLDTVCALTRSVRDAILAHEILAARTVTRSPAPLSAYRLAVAEPRDAGRTGRRPWRAPSSAACSVARGGRADRRDRPERNRRTGWHPGHGWLFCRRKLCLAPRAAGHAGQRLRPARGRPHPARRDHDGPRIP
jgi:aspartyl-tRNA(Asn)/glutamyl-tRNA(Gln) amidotransferase subunit A